VKVPLRRLFSGAALIQHQVHTDNGGSIAFIDVRGDVPTVINISGVVVTDADRVPAQLQCLIFALSWDGDGTSSVEILLEAHKAKFASSLDCVHCSQWDPDRS
jgi:hypothetical protein